MEKSKERLQVIEKIKAFEKEGNFNEDVETDGVAKTIKPKDVDYVNKKLKSKFLTKLANFLGYSFFELMTKKKRLIIKEVHGLDNARLISGGAIITCNHFSIKDNYVVYKSLKPALKKRQKIWKVIKESNYTNFKGPVRLMMRHANTLPLSSSMETMKHFSRAVSALLSRGEKILIYPEQAMWWNYKKPRPLVSGAFKIAVKNNVPILPTFITMKDTNLIDKDGFPVQEYFVYFLPPIYPNKTLGFSENVKILMDNNYNAWVNVYETFYSEKLVY